MPKVSVIISIYNKIEYLKFVLAGFERQTEQDFEIILADDGSNEQSVNEIEKILKNYSFCISHIWHEDKGFRKNKILNKAITASQGAYLIFVDGDCVPHREFVAEHFNNNRKNLCLTGRRINFSEKMTRLFTEDGIRNGYLENHYLRFVYDGLFGNSVDVEKGLYIKNKFLRKQLNKKRRGVVGCNFSLYKEDILRINGFDERYEAASVGEDSDVEYRLRLIGVEISSLNYMAIQYHLYHKLQDRPLKNLRLFEEIKRQNLSFTPYGIVR
jgi:glycosyltransferase involved in cell wall biosynthesis